MEALSYSQTAGGNLDPDFSANIRGASTVEKDELAENNFDFDNKISSLKHNYES